MPFPQVKYGARVLVAVACLSSSPAAASQGASRHNSETAFVIAQARTIADVEVAIGNSSELTDIRTRALEAKFEARQARLLGNPVLDGGWGTIPIGQTNPPDLRNPLRHVPNYSVGIAYTFPLGKLRLRRHLAQAQAELAQAETRVEIHAMAWRVVAAIGEMAVGHLERDLVRARQTELQQELAAANPERRNQILRALSELSDLQVELQREQLDRLGACTQTIGRSCIDFADRNAALDFLNTWHASMLAKLQSPGEIDEAATRGSQASLQAPRASIAMTSLALARRQAWPEPTLRFGYLHDRFVLSGNHRNSLAVSLAVPLPLFDRGQVKVEAVRALSQAAADSAAQQQRDEVAMRDNLRARIDLELADLARIEAQVPDSSSSAEDLAETRFVAEQRKLAGKRRLHLLASAWASTWDRAVHKR